MQVARASNRGTELGYAEITTNFTQSSAGQNTVYDVTGLSVTVTVGSRPIIVRAHLPIVTTSTASASFQARIYEGATLLQTVNALTPSTAGAGAGDRSPQVRLNPTAGSHTYKVSIVTSSSGTPTLTAAASANGPAFIQVVEV